ncbi:AP2 domain-containing protein [Burkholderia sp. JKS000303]|uniref:AP2 domain-containing protein n=1 Tax=Burkholderia sp. JKS000303 TaxID=1938747 RepID=UPI000C014FBE|nr:AP2 domain-containing protein [Burkholderia sp. JKS000303]PFH12876.1 HNH endonuclease [Burkholderia sp. JKS000303]
MKTLLLSQGYVAVVDDADYEDVAQFKWSVLRAGQWLYAMRTWREDGRGRCELMHRRILGLHRGDPTKVDHRDGDGLNNQRNNLRPATDAQNMWNSRRPRNNTSGYKGVSYYTAKRKWCAEISAHSKRKKLGYFDSPEEAYAAYCRAAAELHGEFFNFG